MANKFRQKYNATPFDSSDPRDARFEAARKVILSAYAKAMDSMPVNNGNDLQDIVGGLLVGLVQIGMASCSPSDHTSLRAGLLQLIPWAVDISRDMEGLPPLLEA